MSDEGFILDTPEGIQAFAYLQVYYKLKMEVERPNGPRWKDSPMKQARQIMMKHGRALPVRTRRATFADYSALLQTLGILKD